LSGGKVNRQIKGFSDCKNKKIVNFTSILVLGDKFFLNSGRIELVIGTQNQRKNRIGTDF